MAQTQIADPGNNGGGRGIRTPGTLSGTTVFKTARFNRSRIPPARSLLVYIAAWTGSERFILNVPEVS